VRQVKTGDCQLIQAFANRFYMGSTCVKTAFPTSLQSCITATEVSTLRAFDVLYNLSLVSTTVIVRILVAF
jgi:hypothetical protein